MVIPKFLNLIWAFSFLFILPFQGYTQDSKSIKSKQKQVQKELQLLNKKLKDSQKKGDNLETQINLLDSKIILSERYLDFTCLLIDELDNQLIEGQSTLDTLNQSNDSLSLHYKKALNKAIQIELSVEPLGRMLSFSDINTSNLQKYYFQQIQFKTNSKLITNNLKQDSIKSILTLLNLQRAEKDSLQIEEEIIRNQLLTDIEKHNKSIDNLKEKTTKLKTNIKAKSKVKERLRKQLKKIIQEEIRLASIKEKKSKNKTKKSKTIKVKSLLWPVSKRELLQKFGKHRHPDLKDVMVQNNGIDIKADINEKVKSISKGKVITVTQVPGYQTAIIISNEDLFIVYSGIGNPAVTKGEVIKKDQIIGTIGKGTQESPTQLHLEIWQGKKAINPMRFLK